MHIKSLKELLDSKGKKGIFGILTDNFGNNIIGLSGNMTIFGIQYQIYKDATNGGKDTTRVVDYVLESEAQDAYENGWITNLPMLPEDIRLTLEKNNLSNVVYADEDMLCYSSKDDLYLRYKLHYSITNGNNIIHKTDEWSVGVPLVNDSNDVNKYKCELLDSEESTDDRLDKEINTRIEQYNELIDIYNDINGWIKNQIGLWDLSYKQTITDYCKDLDKWREQVNKSLSISSNYVSLTTSDSNIQGNKTWNGHQTFNQPVVLGSNATLRVSNTTTLNGVTNVNNTLNANKNVNIKDTLSVTGQTNLTTLNITGSVISDATFNKNVVVKGNESVTGTLGVTGKTTLNNTLNVVGAVTNNSTTLTKGTATFGENSRSNSVSLVSNGIANFRAIKINNLDKSTYFGTNTIHRPGVSIYEDAIVLKPCNDNGSICSDGGIIRFNANSYDEGNYLEISTLDNRTESIIFRQYNYVNGRTISENAASIWNRTVTLMDSNGKTTLIGLTLQNVSYGVTPNSGATGKELVTAEWVKTKTSSDNTGMIAFFCCTKNANEGWLLCNGQVVSRTTYASLFNKIGTIYGAGNGSTTFNLPNLKNRFLEGETSANAVNKYVVPGLPNITGAGGYNEAFNYKQESGAFYLSDETKYFGNNGPVDWDNHILCFDASRSNPIYGRSSTVQPSSLRLYPYIHI